MALLRVGGLNPGKRRDELLSNYDGEEPYMPGGYDTPYNGEEPWMPNKNASDYDDDDGYDDGYDDEYDGDYDDDFRLFVHSSVQTVERIVSMLGKHGRYLPPEGQCVYLTHLGLKYRGWPSEKIEAELPGNFRAAYDGLEVVFG